MADCIQRGTMSSDGFLSDAAVQWTTSTATHQSLATPIVSDVSDVASGDRTTSDLLQQAMNEVCFDTVGGVSYMEHSGEVFYLQEDGKLVSLDGVIMSGDMAVIPDSQSTGVVVCGDQQGPATIDVSRILYKSENARAFSEYIPSDPGIVSVTSSATLTCDSTAKSAGGTYEALSSIQINNVRSLSSNQTSIEELDSVPSGTAETDSAPLGSSQNPIRIMQQGNRYRAMQHLTPNQLSQILQVIQQQQQAAQTKNPSSSKSAIFYNPDAGSQVVYRITTSSDSTTEGDLNKKVAVRMVSGAEHGIQKRTIRKRRKEDLDWIAGNELSQQEKEERKKHRPRTRSGRVSKPPQYMVKDYKHIHPVDYDEDYDDSDGGYSDFKHSGDEMDNESKDDSLLDQSGHWKHNKCATCEKRYIGTAGLARHYRLNPTHGEMPPDYSQSCTAMATLDCTSDGLSLLDTPAHEVQDLPSAKDNVPMSSDHSHAPTAVKKRGRGRPPVYKLSDKRKAQLKEVVQRCSSEDLLEVALPKVASVASVWDFLSARLPKGKESASDMSALLQEYNKFRCQVKSVCKDSLSLVSNTNTESDAENSSASQPTISNIKTADAKSTLSDNESSFTTKKYYEMTSSDVADSLGLTVGRYEYVERRQEIVINSTATETNPDASTATDLSHFMSTEVETVDVSLPATGQLEDGERIVVDPMPEYEGNTSKEKSTDKTVDDDAVPADDVTHQPESGKVIQELLKVIPEMQ